MAKEILTNAAFWLDEYDLRGNMNTIAIEGSAEVKDCTCFGDTHRKYQVGPKTVNYSAAGYLEDSIDAALHSEWGTSGNVITIGKGNSLNDIAWVGKVLSAQYTPNMSNAELWAFTFAAQLSERSFGRGRLMENNSNLTASGNGTGRQLRAISANKSLFAALHVLSVAGTDTPTVAAVLQSDDNGSFTSATTRATFDAVGVVGGTLKEVVGAVTDDYWRFVFTVTGTDPIFNVVAALGFEERF